jgi:hypothetical protein
MRRMLFLAVALGVLVTGLIHPTFAAVKDSCEECASFCNTIPMDPGDCLQLYCPECASSSSQQI